MADELKSIDFKQFGAEYPGAEALRAVRLKGGAFLVISRTASTPPLGAETTFAALDAANPNKGWRNAATIRQIVPAQPAWDAAADSGGLFQIVYEKPGRRDQRAGIASVVGRSACAHRPISDAEFSPTAFLETLRRSAAMGDCHRGQSHLCSAARGPGRLVS